MICTTQLYITEYKYTYTSMYMYSSTCTLWDLLQGGVAREGYLRRRITVTLSISNFSTWFLSQIVENRRGRLSRLFLGPGDNFFEKLWRKPDPVGARVTQITLSGEPPPVNLDLEYVRWHSCTCSAIFRVCIPWYAVPQVLNFKPENRTTRESTGVNCRA